MKVPVLITAAAVMSLSFVAREAQAQKHFNPAIDVLEAKQPIFGLYAPAAPRGGGRGGPGGAGRGGPPGAAGAAGVAGATGAAATAAPPAAPAAPPKTPAMLAQEAVGNKTADFIFDGSMEGGSDNSFATFTDYMKGLSAAGHVSKMPKPHLTHPMFVKTPELTKDYDKGAANITRQLNMGAANITFVGVESAEEVRKGLAMMRFKSKGGTRPDDVGDAPAIWGMTEKEYKEKADVWPLNKNGELLNFTIVETKVGLAHVREIAAVKGIGVLFPGAGTLRGVFSTTDSAGKRTMDPVGWEAAIQQVLAACKEFKVPCGYPATEADIEMRMKQGFSVFIINWGEAGFRTVDLGRKTAGRPATNARNN